MNKPGNSGLPVTLPLPPRPPPRPQRSNIQPQKNQPTKTIVNELEQLVPAPNKTQLRDEFPSRPTSIQLQNQSPHLLNQSPIFSNQNYQSMNTSLTQYSHTPNYAIVTPGLNYQQFNPTFENQTYLNYGSTSVFSSISHSNSEPNFSGLSNKYAILSSSLDRNSSSTYHSTYAFERNSSSNQENIIVRDKADEFNDAVDFIPKRPDSNLIDLGDFGTENKQSKEDPFKDLLYMFDPIKQREKSFKIVTNTSTHAEEKSVVKMDDQFKESIEKFSTARYDDKRCSPSSSSSSEYHTPTEMEENNNSKHVLFSKIFRVVHKKFRANDEIIDFCNKVKSIRREYLFQDKRTNFGLVWSPTLERQKDESLSVKLVIETELSDKEISFTCNVNITIEHIISQVLCDINGDKSEYSGNDPADYVLKVFGLNEYLKNDSYLGDYVYVHQCHKFDNDVRMTLVEKNKLNRILIRTSADDDAALSMFEDDLLPKDVICKFGEINCDSMNVLLEILEKEISNLLSDSSFCESHIYTQKVCQATMAICALLGNTETLQLTEAVENLSQLFKAYIQYTRENIKYESLKKEMDFKQIEIFGNAVTQLKNAIEEVIQLFSAAFPVEFEVRSNIRKDLPTVEIGTCIDALICYVGTVCQIQPEWQHRFNEYLIICEYWHGDREISSAKTRRNKSTKGLFHRIVFDEYIQFEDIPLRKLARESFICFTLIGIETLNSDSPSNNNDGAKELHSPIASTVLHIFDYEKFLKQGSFLLGMWTTDILTKTSRVSIVSHNIDRSCPLLLVNLPDMNKHVKFPEIELNPSRKIVPFKRNFEGLDISTQNDINNIVNDDPLQPLTSENKEMLWERRHYLYNLPNALPKLLRACQSWEWSCLSEIYNTIDYWASMSPVDALQLLLPSFPDNGVRHKAIEKWISKLGSDELCDYLPQLVQALRYEVYINSSLSIFLLRNSLENVRIAHDLYWLLKENVEDALFGYRSRILLNTLILICGKSMNNLFKNQENLLNKLTTASNHLKSAKESQRLYILHGDLISVHDFLDGSPISLPINPSMLVNGVEVKLCTYFTSNTLPLKLVFKNPSSNSESSLIEAIYKIGDDLRQDMLTIQIIQIMNKLWLKNGLDLKIVTFRCISTDKRKGMVELVKNSETLRKIQAEFGVTGSFKDRCIAEWLQKHNTSELEYRQAVDNFTLSCAGYAVATYVLGICDRHNDNIMITTSGHLFHIDFGKFLGDSQMIGTIKRDRVPFVLTSDMAYVINGGDKPSKQFQYFVDLCCQAFNIVRRHINVFLNLFSLVISSGIPGVSFEAVHYIHKSLVPHMSEAEATSQFTRMIEESLSSRFTQFNFFIHNLAQLRFTGDHNDQNPLSFVPKKFTQEMDGKIEHLEVLECVKKYDPEKQYFYVIKVKRQNEPEPSLVLRTYREFYEFHQRITNIFSLAKFHDLPRGSMFGGRSNTREIAYKRKNEICIFVNELLTMADEIAHSDLVYTFFHPLLRDQEENKFYGSKRSISLNNKMKPLAITRRDSIGTTNGQVKLSIVYKNCSLILMVMHAKNLQSLRSSTPDSYVKTYLLPDPYKYTKRKTKVIYKNSHPTFMEMIVYEQYPLDELKRRNLEISVWDYDRVQENILLGNLLIALNEIDLLQETVGWYPLSTFN